jgi:hypothetical protein
MYKLRDSLNRLQTRRNDAIIINSEEENLQEFRRRGLKDKPDTVEPEPASCDDNKIELTEPDIVSISDDDNDNTNYTNNTKTHIYNNNTSNNNNKNNNNNNDAIDIDNNNGIAVNNMVNDPTLHPPEFYLKQVHGDRSLHPGARKTWHRLNKCFPGHSIPMRFVEEFIMSCPGCQKDRLKMSNNIDSLTRHLKPEHQRSRVGVDRLTVTPVDEQGNCNLIVVVEHYTKFVSAYPSKSYDAITLATALFQHSCTFGSFDELWSDPGSDLMSDVITQLNKWLGAHHVVSLVDRHESNGVEGTNKQILRHLRLLCHDLRFEKRWSDPTVLALVIFAINDSVNSETGFRPFELKYGTSDGTYCRLPETLDPAQLTSAWLRNLNTDLAHVRAASKKHQNALVAERTAANPPPSQHNRYQPGDFILYQYPKNQPKPTKLSSPHLDP